MEQKSLLNEKRIEKVWNTLNTFRIKYFLTDPKAEVDIGDFDNMMDEIKSLFSNKSTKKMRVSNEQDYEKTMFSLKRKGLVKVWEEDERIIQMTEKGIKEIEGFHINNHEFFVLLSIYFYQENTKANSLGE